MLSTRRCLPESSKERWQGWAIRQWWYLRFLPSLHVSIVLGAINHVAILMLIQIHRYFPDQATERDMSRIVLSASQVISFGAWRTLPVLNVQDAGPS